MSKPPNPKSNGTVVAIINQKGGVGKTTVTTLLANIFHFHLDKKVGILDLDNPQYSIAKRRKDMEELVSTKPYLQKVTNMVYSNREKIDVTASELHNFKTELDRMRAENDLVFIDIAGTLNLVGILNLFLEINHFFIPVFQDEDTLRSSLEFYEQIEDLVSTQSPNFKSSQLFFNRVPFKNRLGYYKAEIKNAGASLMDTILPYYAIYENDYRNTLLPIPLNNVSTNKQSYKLLEFTVAIMDTISASEKKAEDNTETSHFSLAV